MRAAECIERSKSGKNYFRFTDWYLATYESMGTLATVSPMTSSESRHHCALFLGKGGEKIPHRGRILGRHHLTSAAPAKDLR